MTAPFTKNEWDSAFFGREIVTLSPNLPLTLPLPKCQLLQAKVATDSFPQITALQQCGFQLIETEVLFRLAVPKTVLPTTLSTSMRQAKKAHIASLQAQFSRHFTHSRFRSPYFSDEENQRFYAKWIENAVKGQFDHACFFEEMNGQISGMVTLRKGNGEGKIGLLAVAEEYQRQGVGKRLLQYAQNWAAQQGLASLSICTQLSNRVAMALYQSANAQYIQSHYWFYRG